MIEVPSGRELATYGPLLIAPLAVAFSPRRTLGRRGGLRRTGRRSGRSTSGMRRAGPSVQVIPQTAGEDVTTLSFSPDGRRLASAGFDAKIKIWDTESGLELLTLNGHTSWIWKMQFSPDGRRILSCGRDKTLRIWDASPLQDDAAGPPQPDECDDRAGRSN